MSIFDHKVLFLFRFFFKAKVLENTGSRDRIFNEYFLRLVDAVEYRDDGGGRDS